MNAQQEQIRPYVVEYFDIICMLRTCLTDDLKDDDCLLATKMREAALSGSGDMRKDYIYFEALGYAIGRGEVKEQCHSQVKEQLKMLYKVAGPNSPVIQNWPRIDDAIMRGWDLSGAKPIENSRTLFDPDFKLSCRGFATLAHFLDSDMD